MEILSVMIGYGSAGLLAYIGFHSFKAYKEHKENQNDK